MNTIFRFFRSGLSCMIWFWILAAGVMPAQGATLLSEAALPPVPPDNQQITLEAANRPLGEILAAIQRECSVEVTGLDARLGESISFSAADESAEVAIKRLLRNLDETNYAFFYNQTQLHRVSVVPKARTGATPPLAAAVPEIGPEAGEAAPSPQDASEKAVQVSNVNTGTQAEDLDLREGDLVIEYDGIRIENTQQLVSIVKEKADADTIEMVVVRDGTPHRMTLKGGLIGINVKTVPVSGTVPEQP
ncbi:PDZ domain-containing protein [Desulfococcus multivorans]|uniref:PDZ/DHR/GLGF domain protein n=1 Tax=Desulfococcus multivorans DSM 2059 TaxID=1121405 RepID=S7V4J7_DESML|nr:PDZ domain-containing protein [Desulfococcus multivorans]AQV00920.1 hypothetical protein B2D07_09185 [Desulfococcus multivorans]EPR41524.1 PDZ/DHR/GLGF domain protein [Desulfococcus multivorans DSM 2059]SJZ44949.1 PDZ domain-containing protein [Desulfococcus multivorans DSM 2059]